MKVLVTGANGMLGQDLCPILEDVGFYVIETDINTLDITHFEEAENILTANHPDMVIHCAAYTNVDKAEEDLKTATKINVTGTENIAKICGKLDIPIVYISTDYVFDGAKTTPYEPDDKPDPINNYGLTKLQGEQAVLKYCKKYWNEKLLPLPENQKLPVRDGWPKPQLPVPERRQNNATNIPVDCYLPTWC